MSALLPIRVEGLAFRPGDAPVLNGVTVTLAEPGVTAIVGPNGAGKSVLLRLLDGLLAPDAGTIQFGTRAMDEVRRAFVFQAPALVRASVLDNVALALLPAGLGRRERTERARHALDRVGLADRAGDAARKLSGGEQQRLALARALVTAPELLLLDEPTASLDPGATDAIEALVAGLAAEGVKVVLVSHHLGQVARLARDVVVLARGRVVEHGPARAVLTEPRTPEARAYFTGEMPWTAFAAAS